MALLSRFLRPEASRRMLVDEGEFIVDEVTRHWVTRVVPVLIVIAATPISAPVALPSLPSTNAQICLFHAVVCLARCILALPHDPNFCLESM